MNPASRRLPPIFAWSYGQYTLALPGQIMPPGTVCLKFGKQKRLREAARYDRHPDAGISYDGQLTYEILQSLELLQDDNGRAADFGIGERPIRAGGARCDIGSAGVQDATQEVVCERMSPPDKALIQQEREAIDATFASLADDEEFQAESVAFAEEGVASGWKALRLTECDL